jgi:uncharacterized protein YjbI with pentapeptide repeats
MDTLELSSQNLQDRLFEGQKLEALAISGSEFIACKFKGIKAKSVSLGGGDRQSRYTDCVFEGCDFKFFALGNVFFERCTFNACKLSNLFSIAGEFVDCDFDGSILRRGAINRTVPEDSSGSYRRKFNRIERNDFSRSVLIDFDFRGGVELVERLLPTNSQCIFVADTCMAAKTMAIQGDRGRVQKLLEYYCSSGQRQQLLFGPFTDRERNALTSMVAA